MKISFQSEVVPAGRGRFAVVITAIAPTIGDAHEIRRWLEAALKNAAGARGTIVLPGLIVPPGRAGG